MHDDHAAALDWRFPGCPDPANPSVDATRLLNQFHWLRAMHGVEQEPEYHAEGDVQTHTFMVAAALIALPEWQALAPVERSLMFMAALLHDVAKPACTLIDPTGRISSPGHARRGATMVHSLLWHTDELDTPMPFACRETIARRVRHHGLPLWFWDKDDPARAVILASQVVRLDRVALLAEADVRGRICADQQALLDRVDLFREFCREQGCYDRPYPFATDLARFYFCRTPGSDPNYVPYDDTKYVVTILSGLPASGKDFWCARFATGEPVISLDAIRQELHIDPAARQGMVIQLARKRLRDHLRRQQSCIYNATNVTRLHREQIIDLATAYQARVRLIYLEAPAAVIFARNQARARPVPLNVILRMLRHLEVPDRTEAPNVEWRV